MAVGGVGGVVSDLSLTEEKQTPISKLMIAKENNSNLEDLILGAALEDMRVGRYYNAKW